MKKVYNRFYSRPFPVIVNNEVIQMKNKLFILFMILALALSFSLASCGADQNSKKKTEAATTAPTTHDVAVKQATADTAAPAASAAATEPQSTESAVSSRLNEQGTDAPSSDSDRTAPTAYSAVSDSMTPSFTITMKNLSTKKTYSAACSYAADKEGVATAYFFITGGEYEIDIAEYSDTGEAVVPEATGSYSNPVGTNERQYVRVDYSPETGIVEITAINHADPS